jgi:enamine deaminase RidA (YjgF/YER057c/UK114 family)
VRVARYPKPPPLSSLSPEPVGLCACKLCAVLVCCVVCVPHARLFAAVVCVFVWCTCMCQVANGASDLFAQVFEERGVHARSAVGTNSLPLNIPVEIEAIVELTE